MRLFLIFLLILTTTTTSRNKWADAAARPRPRNRHVTPPPPTPLLAASPSLEWKGSTSISRPSQSPHSLLLSSLDGSLHALDPVSGEFLWSFPGLGPLVSATTPPPNHPLLVPSIDGSIFLHSGSTDDALQSVPMSVPDLVNASPLTASDSLYIGTKDTQILRVNPINGQVQYMADLTCDEDEFAAPFLLARVEHTVKVLSQSGQQMYNFSWAEWKDISDTALEFPIDTFVPSMSAEMDGWISAWDSDQLLWRVRLPSPVVHTHFRTSDGVVKQLEAKKDSANGLYIGQLSNSLFAVPRVSPPALPSSSALVPVGLECVHSTGPCIPLVGFHNMPEPVQSSALVPLVLPSIDEQSSLVIPVAVAMFALCVIVIVVAWRRRQPKQPPPKRKKKKKEKEEPKKGSVEMVVGDTVLGLGSHGTEVRYGTLGGRRIAVKRMLRRFYRLAEAEVALLVRADAHPNVVRYLSFSEDGDFVYLALELCEQTLEEAIEANNLTHAQRLVLLRGIVNGIAHLHKLSIVHRDIKPANILLDADGTPRISDMALGKQLEDDRSSFGTLGTGWGSVGWRAPEVLKKGRTTRAVDIFSLGCVSYYVLTGRHPYGLHPERDGRIFKNDPTLDGIDPVAHSLIASMLDADADARPTSQSVASHPLFWDTSRRLSFLLDFSDRVEVEPADASLVLALDKTVGAQVLGKRPWDEQLGADLIANLGKYRKYNVNGVRDLLRVIRNKRHHYRDLPAPLQAELGEPPCGYLSYFESRFPLLFIRAWEFGKLHKLDEEVSLSQYYS